jgi:hypothetical protein
MIWTEKFPSVAAQADDDDNGKAHFSVDGAYSDADKW